MPRNHGITLGEFTGIRAGSLEEESYEANLRECLTAKASASAEADMTGAGHAARGAAECYRRLGRLQEAATEYRVAAELLKTAGDRRGLAWTLLTYSNLLRQQSAFAAALGVLSESQALAQSCGDRYLAAYILAGIAETNRIVGTYTLAHKQHLEAFRIFRSLDDARGTVWALEGIGQMLKNTGRISEALHHFAEARKLAAQAKDLRGLAYALKCHAECLFLLGHRTAIEESLVAVQIFENIGLKVGLGYALKSCGDINRRRVDHAAALGSYRSAAQVFTQSNDARGLAYTVNGIGSVLSETGNAEDAGICFAHTICYFKTTGLRFGRGESSASLSSLVQERQLRTGHVYDMLEGGLDGSLLLPGILREDSSSIPKRSELAHSGWRLLNQYWRRGIRYMRAEEAKVWEGSKHADCSSFVQHTLIEAGYGFARSGRLTTARLQRDVFWSECFREIPRFECKPRDIILQGGLHMGILTGFRNEKPKGLQMGVTSRASELLWGEGGQTVRFFRLKRNNDRCPP